MSVGTGMLVMLLGEDRILFSGASGGGLVPFFSPRWKSRSKRHTTDDADGLDTVVAGGRFAALLPWGIP